MEGGWRGWGGGGGSLARLKVPSENASVSGETQRGEAGLLDGACEEEYFNMLSLVLMPTHGGINRQRTYACTGLRSGVGGGRGGGS